MLPLQDSETLSIQDGEIQGLDETAQSLEELSRAVQLQGSSREPQEGCSIASSSENPAEKSDLEGNGPEKIPSDLSPNEGKLPPGPMLALLESSSRYFAAHI